MLYNKILVGCIFVLSFSACGRMIQEEPCTGKTSPGRIPFELYIGKTETKVCVGEDLVMEWNEGDQIILFHAVAGSQDYIRDGVFTALSDGSNVIFYGDLAEHLSDGEYDWYAYSFSDDNGSPDHCFCALGNTWASDADDVKQVLIGLPMAGCAYSVPSDSTPRIVMQEISSLIRFGIINGLSTPIQLSKAEFIAPEEVSGSFVFDITKTEFRRPESGSGVDHDNLARSSIGRMAEIVPKDTLFLYTSIKPFVGHKGSSLIVAAHVKDNGVQQKTVSLNEDYPFNRGEINTLFFTYDKLPSDSPIIEFQDAIMEEICVNWFDSNMDGKLSMEEAASVTELPENFISYFYAQKGVKKFNELSYFTSLKRIGQGAFSYAKTLEEISIPDSVEEIGYQAFMGLSQLKEISLPSSLKFIDRYAFNGCSAIPCDLSFPHGITCISDGAFGNTAITSVVLHEDITSIGNFSFADCTQLASFDFGNVQIIEEGAFSGCTALRYIHLPESLKTMEPAPFTDCIGIRQFSGKGASADGLCLVLDGYLYAYACGDNLNPVLAISPDVKTIGQYVFRNLEFEHLDIPEGIEEIGWAAFLNCHNLKSVNLPGTLRTLVANSFSQCASLEEITFPSSIREIGAWSFTYCTALKRVYCKSIVPPEISARVFEDSGLESIYVPTQTLSAYNKFWGEYKSYLKPYDYPDLEELEDYYSTDFSADGSFYTIQSCSEGEGIDLVLMGDYFSDRQIADGTYDSKIREAVEAFFEPEPYASFRNLFNVYAVNVVSPSEGYFSLSGEVNAGSLGIYFGEGTRVGGNDSKVSSYALNAITASRMDNAVIIVIVNRTYHAGTCYMYNSGSSSDFGCGLSISYFPLGYSKKNYYGLVQHEAGGHGFAKLADEYFYTLTIPDSEVDKIKSLEKVGWYKNVDFTPNAEEVKWSRFLFDSRYEAEELGVYEGAATYRYGVYRPSDNSIMRDNTGGYNAPSRYAIWYRIHKLAFSYSWMGSYEDFVTYDLPKRTIVTRRKNARSSVSLDSYLDPLSPPVIINTEWREALGFSNR